MYCPHCGTSLKDTALFCPECGTRQKGIENTVHEPPNMQVTAKTNPTLTVPNATRGQNQSRRLVVFRAVSCLLILAMTISATVKLLPGGIISVGANRGKLVESKTVNATLSEPIVSAAGVTVDVNPLNLTDGDKKLTVKKYEQKNGENGFLGEEYDISLGNQHYLRAPLTVTLPYDESASQDCEICILHYDSDYEQWIAQQTVKDAAAGTISAKLTTLSPVRLVYFDKDYSNSLYYISNKGHTNATLEVSYSYWDIIKGTPMEPAKIVAQDYILNGNTNSSVAQLNKAGNAAISSLNTYFTLYGALADTVFSTAGTLAASGSMLSNVTSKASQGIGVLSLVIAGTQLMFDLETKDSTGPRNETAINLYKNIASNGGTLYSFCTGYSSATLSLGFFAVAVTGYMLDTLVEEAKTIQANTVEAVFDAYYSEHSTFNENDWYDLFVDAYWDAWQNNRNSKDGMDYAVKKVTEAIDAHAEEFWDVIYAGGSDALTFAVADAGKKNFFTPTAEQKKELTSRFKEDMFLRFNDTVIPWINEFMQERMQNAVYSSLMLTAKPYNIYQRVQIQEIAPEDSDEKCKFQSCPIRFGTSEDFVAADYPEEWQLLAPEDDREWAVKLDFTLLGYLMAGSPDKVFLFDAWDEEKRFGDQIHTEVLTLVGEEDGYMSVIDLTPSDGMGPYKAFQSNDKEIAERSTFLLFIGSLIEDSIKASDSIDITSLGGGKFSFTVPAYTVKIKWNYDTCEQSITSTTFVGTMNKDMTSGTFEVSGTPTVKFIINYYSGDSVETHISDVRISATIEPNTHLKDTLLVTLKCKYNIIRGDDVEECVYDDSFSIKPIRD